MRNLWTESRLVSQTFTLKVSLEQEVVVLLWWSRQVESRQECSRSRDEARRDQPETTTRSEDKNPFWRLLQQLNRERGKEWREL